MQVLEIYHISIAQSGVTKHPLSGAWLAAGPARALHKLHFCSCTKNLAVSPHPSRRVPVTVPGGVPGLGAP